MTRFPWDEAKAFGLGVMRLSPAAFWAMTPRELMAAFRARGGGPRSGPGRSALEALMARYPDAEESKDE